MKHIVTPIFFVLLIFCQDSIESKAELDLNMLMYQNTKLSDHFYVNFTIGKEATKNIKTQFYLLSPVDINIIGARNATRYNMNWAQEIHDEQTNKYFRGINPVGLLYVMATWSGLIPDPTTAQAFENAKKEFVGEKNSN